MSAIATEQPEFDDVLAREQELIEKQRRVRGLPPHPERRVGLAISGGGIRSASFGLGMLQALESLGHLKHVDYLSTVSGGGYVGSSLTWFNYLHRVRPDLPIAPLGSKYQARRITAWNPGKEDLGLDGTAFIRQQGEYLTPSRSLTMIGLTGVLLRNVLVTFSVYFSLVLAATILLQNNYPLVISRTVERWAGSWLPASLAPGALLFGLYFIACVLFAFATFTLLRFFPRTHWLYAIRVRAQQVLGWALGLVLAALIAGSIPIVFDHLGQWKKLTLSFSTTTGLGGVVYEFVKEQKPALKKLWPKLNVVVVSVAGMALIYSVLMLAYAAATGLGSPGIAVAPYLALYGLAVGLFMNSNAFSIYQMYRDRLMEAFMPDPEAVRSRKWKRADRADVGLLKDVCTDRDPGPYHIINTNVVLGSSDEAYCHGRGGDNFILSPLYCGSEAIGWWSTSEFCGGKMSLATAMAISGAAINPNAACGGEGPTRNRLASFMLALFNVRLGYWVRNPSAVRKHGRWVSWWWPNLLVPGLRQGLLGTGQHRRAVFLELTDGGHFENTGIYELVRRRLDSIVLSLASADPEYGYDDLADAIERVRVDFSVYIKFPTLFKESVPGSSAPPPTGIAAALKMCQESHCIGIIEYPNGKRGQLLVLKSALTPNLPVDVLRYAATHTRFPNESTVDQFFDERQFEAYRELGYAAGRDMLAEFLA